MIRIAIVDDHILTLKGTQQLLSEEENFLIVHSTTDGRKLLSYLASNPSSIDVVLLDLNMPEINGVTMCKKIKAQYAQVKVVILSMIDDVNMIARMIKYNADGYLLKNDIQSELNQAIESVMDGQKYFNKEIKRLLAFQKRSDNSPRKNSLRPRLSRRELEVLDLIVKEFTTPEIAIKLFISEGTVITHRKHILSKMGVKNTAGIVRTALEWGLLG